MKMSILHPTATALSSASHLPALVRRRGHGTPRARNVWRGANAIVLPRHVLGSISRLIDLHSHREQQALAMSIRLGKALTRG